MSQNDFAEEYYNDGKKREGEAWQDMEKTGPYIQRLGRMSVARKIQTKIGKDSNSTYDKRLENVWHFLCFGANVTGSQPAITFNATAMNDVPRS